MDFQENHVIYTFPRGKGEEIQMALKKHNDRYYIDLRHWFQGKTGNQFLPTKRGIHFPVDLFPELRKGVDRLAKAIDRLKRKKEDLEI